MNNYRRILAVRRSGNVKRFHTMPLIGEQTVAAHSWNVLVILLEICPNPTTRLLRAAVYHDAAEYATGDSPSQAKRRDHRLKTILDELETKVYEEMDIDMSLTPAERMFIKVADLLEMLFYVREQRLLGNRSLEIVWYRVVSWLHNTPNIPLTAHELLSELTALEEDPYDHEPEA